MTTYKRDPLLDAAIASILNQSYQNIELVIVDDCSPDDNFSYLKQHAELDAPIRVFQKDEHGGTYLAKNFGMTQARGEFIGFMDSDDYCHAQRIEFQVASLDAHPKVMGVTHDYFRIDESSDIEFRGIGALRMACISLLIRREVVDEIGFFDSLRVGADTEYIERIEANYGNERRLRLPNPVHVHDASFQFTDRRRTIPHFVAVSDRSSIKASLFFPRMAQEDQGWIGQLVCPKRDSPASF